MMNILAKIIESNAFW